METTNPIQKLAGLDLNNLRFPLKRAKDINGWVEYSENGESNKAKSLLSEAGISVAQWYNSNGFELPLHIHKEKEWVILYRGNVDITLIDDEDIETSFELLPGDYLCIEAGTKHKKIFKEDSWYIAITIPQSFDWPE